MENEMYMIFEVFRIEISNEHGSDECVTSVVGEVQNKIILKRKDVSAVAISISIQERR